MRRGCLRYALGTACGALNGNAVVAILRKSIGESFIIRNLDEFMESSQMLNIMPSAEYGVALPMIQSGPKGQGCVVL